ncbi:MAG: hypothetical protein R3D66_03935 [Alphaproteobacteria bacterium]
MSEGWHSYWKVSGDAGLPPCFDWSGSDNIEKADIFWPMPHRWPSWIFRYSAIKTPYPSLCA